MYIVLNYKYTLYIKIAYINYLAGSLNIYIGKTLVPNSGTLSGHLFVDKKLYYNSSLSLNESIDLTNISL